MLTFEKLWNLHWHWRKDVLLEDIISCNTVDIYKGIPKDKYSTFAVPKLKQSSDLNLEEVRSHIPKKLLYPVCLLDKHRDQGFYEYLIKNKYVFHNTGSWLVYDGDFKLNEDQNNFSRIVPVTLKNLSEFTSVLDESDKENNTDNESIPYYNAYKKILKNPRTLNIPDLKAEFYLIYDEKKPVCAGTLVYSQKENFAYITLGATLQKYVKSNDYMYYMQQYRLNRAIQLGLTTIYSIADFGTYYWRNFLWLGFKEIQEERLFVNYT